MIDFEDTSSVGRSDECGSTLQPPGGPVSARIDIPRALLNTRPVTDWVDRLDFAPAVGKEVLEAIVEHRDQTCSASTLFHHDCLVLRVEAVGVSPDNLAGKTINDKDRVEVSGTDQNITRPEALITGIEPSILRQLVD